MKYPIPLMFSFLLILSCGQVASNSKNIKDSANKGFDTVKVMVDPQVQAKVKEGLWAYYNFNGDMKDKSGNGRDITGYNNIHLSYDLFGNDNSALLFNGIDNYAVINKGREFPEGDFSICFLMMSKTLQGEILHKTNLANAQGASFGIGFDDADQDDNSETNLIYDVSTSNNLCISNVDPSTFLYARKHLYADAWYFVTITFVQGLQKLYINGQLIGTKQDDKKKLDVCSDATINLGIWWNFDPLYFSGKIDELRIYTRALEDSEVQYLSKDILP